MKKILFTLLFIGFLNCKAQQTEIKYDSLNNYSYVNVSPVVVFHDTISRLCVKIIDNVLNEGLIYFQLRTSEGKIVLPGNLYLRGVDYDDYLTNEYLYNYVANNLQLLIKP